MDVCCTGFIVKDLQVNGDPTFLEMIHDGVEGQDPVMVCFRLEGLHQNDICHIMIGKYDVLVATHCADWELPKNFGEQCSRR